MASTLKHLRSSTADKRPTASGLVDGQLAINTASGTPAVFFKDSNGGVVKVGPAHVGASAPNAVPAGSAGNSLGELWVDNSLTTPGLNYYTGSAFVNLTPSGTTAAVGLVELATPAETQTGTDGVRAVTPSGLQSKVSDSTSTTSSTTIASSTAVKSAYDLANAALPKAGGTVTGELLIGTTGSLVFEGSSDDSFETTIAVTNPTADHTITFPNVTGTVVTTGDSGTVTSTMIANDTIVNADINSAAAIAYSKLALSGGIVNTDISASAAIVDTKLATISTADKVSISALNIDGATDIGGALESGDLFIVDDGAGGTNRKAPAFRMSQLVYSGVTGDITIASGGTSAIGAGVIVNADVNASAAIAGTKISPDFGSQNTTTTGTSTAASFIPTSSSVPTNGVYLPAANSVAVATNGTGRLFVDSSGRVLVGTSTARAAGGHTGRFQLEGTNYEEATASIAYNANDANGGYLHFIKTRTGNTVVQNGDLLGHIRFYGTDGSAPVAGVSIKAEVDGTPGANDMPGRLVLSTTADGASSPTERMRITSAGLVGIGTSSPAGLLHLASTFGTTLTTGLRIDGLGATTNNVAPISFYTQSSNWGTQHAANIACGNLGGTDGGGYLRFSTSPDGNTAPAERLRITAAGLVGIGVTSPDVKLHVATGNATGYIKIDGGTSTSATTGLQFRADSNNYSAEITSYQGNLQFTTGVTERARIDSSGRLLVGTSSAAGGQIEAKTATVASGNPAYDKKAFIANIPYSTTNITSSLLAGFDGSGIHGVDIGYRYNGSGYDLTFGTNSTTTGSPTERCRIDSAGHFLLNKTAPNVATNGVELGPGGGGYLSVSRGSDVPFFVNRNTSDGTLVNLNQDGTTEGTISVSGTTVSYNGAHLSRWSQLPSGAERIEILRGSVLSNLDEMCEWGNEDNEQLNRMKVSDVEGDKNVSGVFQCWDDDDDTYTNDFYCAMTGDFIIRIAAGVTVERGDLLMSAGDGTAKPQDDDIIRSKTIAKVTSTNVSCTYDDGSYCVPCVLMAC